MSKFCGYAMWVTSIYVASDFSMFSSYEIILYDHLRNLPDSKIACLTVIYLKLNI